jgi:hypothetical protein
MSKLSDEELEKLADKWLKENDWDYQKYNDKRPDRSAYNTMMFYEISDMLSWAYADGYKAALAIMDEIDGTPNDL